MLIPAAAHLAWVEWTTRIKEYKRACLESTGQAFSLLIDPVIGKFTCLPEN